jgi:hypothetical protein
MIVPKRIQRLLAWFIAGLISAFALVALSAIGQPANATMNQIKSPGIQLDVPQKAPTPVVQAPFIDIVATHQEPNFYD